MFKQKSGKTLISMGCVSKLEFRYHEASVQKKVLCSWSSWFQVAVTQTGAWHVSQCISFCVTQVCRKRPLGVKQLHFAWITELHCFLVREATSCRACHYWDATCSIVGKVFNLHALRSSMCKPWVCTCCSTQTKYYGASLRSWNSLCFFFWQCVCITVSRWHIISYINDAVTTVTEDFSCMYPFRCTAILSFTLAEHDACVCRALRQHHSWFYHWGLR